jgi:gliding motility-associated-like protein
MKNASVAFLLILFSFCKVSAQLLYTVDQTGHIAIVDLSNCSITPVTTMPPQYDIAMCPNDTTTIYGIGAPPSIGTYAVNVQTGVVTTLLPSWPASVTPVPTCPGALVCDGQGHLYTCDDCSSNFYMYDIATNTWSWIGSISPYMSGGDLTYLNGQLYLSTTGSAILAITLSPFSYSLTSQMNISNVWGINTVVIPTACGFKEQMIACSGSSIYYVDPATGITTPVCQNLWGLFLQGGIYGATSTVGSITYVPLTTTLTSTPANCGVPVGSATVTVTSATTPPYTYTWLPTGGTNAVATGLAAGTYTVITKGPTGCPDTNFVTVTAIGNLNATIASSPAPCAVNGSATVTVTSGSSPYTYNWSPAGGTNATATGLVPGNYTVSVKDAAGCLSSQTVTVTGSAAPPVANFSSNPVCIGVPTNFSDLSTGPPSSWNWTFGNGNTSTIQNPSNTYTAAGTYTVTLIVSSGPCGSDTISIPVTVNPLPLASFSNTTVCFNNPTLFTDGSTGNNTISQWGWNFGDGTTSAVQNPSHTYSAPGTYTASLIVTNNFGCKDSVPLVTIVNPLPVVNFSSAPVCLGDSTCFTDLSSITAPGSITAWSWNFGDPASAGNNISNSQKPCHKFSAAGTFSVTLTVTSNNNCQNITVLPVTINPLPVAAFSNNSPCLGSTTTLMNGSTSSASDPITGWNWTMVSGTPAAAATQNTSTSYNAAGTYTVNLIVTTKAGCKDTVDQPVIVHSPPLANFTGGGAGCGPLCNTYNDFSTSSDGTITTWSWSFPGGSPASSNLQNPTNICYYTAGTYGASLIITSSLGCKDTVNLPSLVTVYPWPQADFCLAPDKAPATDPVFTFCPLWTPFPDVTNWVWDFGDGSPLDSTSTNPVHSYSAVATSNDFYSFDVCLRVQNIHGCWDTICHPVDIIPEFEFYIPNTFTPNGDGINEFFFGKCRGVKDFNIWVFDRWGNMIWDCKHSGHNTDWDGSGQDGLSSFCQWNGVVQSGGADMSGNSRQLAQEDVYVWKVKLTDIFEKQHDYIGNVNIVR